MFLTIPTNYSFSSGSPYGYDEDEEEGEQWGNGMGMGMDPMFQSQMMGLMQFASMMEQAMMGSFGSEMGGQFASPQGVLSTGVWNLQGG